MRKCQRRDGLCVDAAKPAKQTYESRSDRILPLFSSSCQSQFLYEIIACKLTSHVLIRNLFICRAHIRRETLCPNSPGACKLRDIRRRQHRCLHDYDFAAPYTKTSGYVYPPSSASRTRASEEILDLVSHIADVNLLHIGLRVPPTTTRREPEHINPGHHS